MNRTRTTTLLASGAAVVVLLAACGDDDTTASSGVEVSGAWARTSPMGVEAGAAYLQITSDDTSSIVAASVPADVAGVVELHETTVADMDMSDDDMAMDDDMSDDDMAMDDEMSDDDMAMDDMEGEDGHTGDMAMMMQQVDSIALPAGETVSLEPGGLHVMMLELPDPLERGETFELTLTLEDGEEIVVDVEVRDDAP